LPGDQVQIKGGALYINGSAVLDSGPNRRLDDTEVFKVPPNYYVVLGDNRDSLIDSSMLSPRIGVVSYVPRALVVGVASWICWSPHRSRIGSRVN